VKSASDLVPGLEPLTCFCSQGLVCSIKAVDRAWGTVTGARSQEKNLSRGRNFSYFAAHVNERDLF
jgi:hypothetical protein